MNPVEKRQAVQRDRAKSAVAGKLPADSPQIDYMGPECGPFRCSNCEYFVADGQPCKKVADPIAAGGCCNKFEKKDK